MTWNREQYDSARERLAGYNEAITYPEDYLDYADVLDMRDDLVAALDEIGRRIADDVE